MSTIRYTTQGNLLAKMLKLGDIPRDFCSAHHQYETLLIDMYYGGQQLRIMGRTDEKNVACMATELDASHIKNISVIVKEFREDPDLSINSTILVCSTKVNAGEVIIDAVPLADTPLGYAFERVLRPPVVPIMPRRYPAPQPAPEYYPDPVPFPRWPPGTPRFPQPFDGTNVRSPPITTTPTTTPKLTTPTSTTTFSSNPTASSSSAVRRSDPEFHDRSYHQSTGFAPNPTGSWLERSHSALNSTAANSSFQFPTKNNPYEWP